MEELYREVEELRNIESEVQKRVSQVQQAGETIDEDMNKWLEKAHNIGIKMKSNSLIDVKGKLRISRLFSRNSKSRKLKETSNIKASITDLVDKGKSLISTKGIDLVWRGGFADFRSRRPIMAKIIEGLKDDGIGIIGISGLGGIGKTLLVTEVGKKVKGDIFDHVLMATVSRHPDVREIQGSFADMLDLKFRHDDEVSRANDLRSRLDKESKVLVILDDVWEVVNMDTIGVSSCLNKKGCKIIVTTRHMSVCKDMFCTMNVQLDVIDRDDAWDLFKEHADLLNGRQSPRLLTMARNIARECGGLPLAIVVVGRALRGKDIEGYDDALQRLSNSDFVDVESADKDIYSCLKLSYDYLDDEDAKKCFLFCSVFPEDSRIFAEQLTRYACGKCLFQNVNSVDEARKRIFTSMNKLEDALLLSRITRVINRKGDYFTTSPIVKMHDMVRDVALYISRQIGDFFYVLTPTNNLQSDRKYKNATAFYLREYGLNWRFPNKLVYSNLKIMIIKSYLSESSFEDIPENLLEVTSTLQVLDMHPYNPTSRKAPPILLESLNNLRSLRLVGDILSRCKDKDISMIGKLKNLEILELSRSSHYTLLPEWVGELSNLRLLDLSEWHSLEVIPSKLLVKLAKLQELYTPFFHNRSQWNTNFLCDLKSLPCLTAFAGTFLGFKSIPVDSVFGNFQWYYINCRPYHLKNEKIRWSRSLGLDDVNELSMTMFEKFLPGVECLKIVGQNYIRCIQNVCPQIDTTGFQELRELHLECISSMECIIDATGNGLGLPSVFPKLVDLSLVNITQLQKFCHGEPPSSYMPDLRRALIKDCQNLKNIVPDMLLNGSNFEEFEIGQCYVLKYVYDLVEEQSIRHAKYWFQFPLCPKVIKLYDLHQLRSIWKLPCQTEFRERHMYVELHKLIVKCLDSLAKMKVHACLELEEVFPLVELNSNEKSDVQLSNLVELELQFLPKLKCIWKGHHQNCSLQNLEHIKVADCGTLTGIFPATLSRSLHKLQHLVIHECRALETVIVQDDVDEVMKCSCSHTLGKCFKELKEIITKSPCPQTLGKCFHELKEIDIKSCDKLKTVLPMSFVSQGLSKLQSISIEDCAELEHLFGGHGKESVTEAGPVNNHNSEGPLSNLAVVYLALLPKLKYIWNDNQQRCGFKNLKNIELKECQTLTRLFTSTSAQSLQQLQYLLIDKCEALEMIITQDEEVMGPISSRSKFSFQELKLIQIKSCDKLRTVLPISFVAQGLPKLEGIFIQDCAELEQVFGVHGEEILAENGKITMNSLKDLTLLGLPSLVRLSPLKCDIPRSSLSLLVESEVPSIMDRLNIL